jgi:hypothetical protein
VNTLDRVIDGRGGFPLWLPHFGTLGKTYTYYLLFFDFLRFVALPAALMWVAYAYGRYRSAGFEN